MTDTGPPITDTPMVKPSFPPPPALDQWKAFIGDLARPFAIIAIALAEAAALWKGTDAGVITAGGVVLAALYGAKSLENHGAQKQQASVEIAKATTPGAQP